MRLEIAGINHFDPLGRGKLKLWIDKVSALYMTPPGFVAVEWDEKLFNEVKSQRAKFLVLARSEWPDAHPDLLETLQLSLAYEADTHAILYPNLAILWLDQGRQYSVSDHAERHLALLKSFLSGKPMTSDTREVLERLSRVAYERAQSPQEGSQRDAAFACLVMEELKDLRETDWAIVIVGAGHASATLGTMRSLLERKGIDCSVSVL